MLFQKTEIPAVQNLKMTYAYNSDRLYVNNKQHFTHAKVHLKEELDCRPAESTLESLCPSFIDITIGITHIPTQTQQHDWIFGFISFNL